jgi:hypothetical protein
MLILHALLEIWVGCTCQGRLQPFSVKGRCKSSFLVRRWFTVQLHTEYLRSVQNILAKPGRTSRLK